MQQGLAGACQCWMPGKLQRQLLKKRQSIFLAGFFILSGFQCPGASPNKAALFSALRNV
ncbi:hypothetical protein C4K20_1463 [Pseudomonas chlororaphis subsp. aurantiaca]|nr:hypothetical protein C4K20_1463 [Pseudomonas chlororaphis subsp. aurantiaca]